MRSSCKILLFFIVLIFSSLHCIAQDSIIRFGGIVTDEHENPLSFAHVYINDSVGTVTNDSGLFVLKLPDFSAKELIASQIGYVNDTTAISEIPKEGFIAIRLLKASNILDEVVVSSEKIRMDSAAIVLKQALKRIPRNYPQKKYAMKGFYRETSMLDTTYSRLLEGYFLVSDKGYDNPVEDVKIKKLHFRKTEDNRNLNWRSSLSEWLYGDNGLYKLLVFDRIRLKAESSHRMEYQENKETKKAAEGSPYRFLSNQFIENTDFYLEEVIREMDEDYYIIRYNKKSAPSINIPYNIYGKITIKGSDWAVVSWESIHAFDEKRFIDKYAERHKEDPDGYKRNFVYHRYKNGAINGSILFTLNTQYKKHKDGKYYLDYISHKTMGSNSSFWRLQDFEQSWNSDGKVGNIYTSLEFAVSQVGKYSKIRWIDRVSHDKDLYNLSSSKNDPFWAKYNYPSVITLSRKMMKDLADDNEQEIAYIND